MNGAGRSQDLPALDGTEIRRVLRRAMEHDNANPDRLWEERGIEDTRDTLELVARALGVPLSLETDALTFFSMGMSFGYELALARLLKMDNGEDETSG